MTDDRKEQDATTPITPSSVDVLLVDDDRLFRDMIAAALQAEGYTVAVAHDGQHALATLATAPAQLILLDLQMPVMDGYEFVRRLREWGLAIPVIFMSSEPTVRADANSLAVAGALPKPFDLAHLFTLVEAHVPNPHA
jgi:two-component system, chemotaxis family, chemotaxis protein CheY